jgi:hypothetical protein
MAIVSEKSNLNFAKASLIFFAISVATILITLVAAWLIITINGGFTFWVIIPFLVGFPVTVLINIIIAKKTISRSQSDLPIKGPEDEKTE